MTYNDQNRTNRPHDQDRTDNTWTWVIGALAALAVLGGIYYAMSDRGDQSASTNTPTATTGAAPTAGQGANQPTTPPAQPAPANR